MIEFTVAEIPTVKIAITSRAHNHFVSSWKARLRLQITIEDRRPYVEYELQNYHVIGVILFSFDFIFLLFWRVLWWGVGRFWQEA